MCRPGGAIRPFGRPSPGGRRTTRRSFPLPPGEGGAKRRVRDLEVLTQLFERRLRDPEIRKSTTMITVVDYKLNNLRSIENTLRRLGHDVQVTSDPEVVQKAQKLSLPGVGAFRDAMENLRTYKLVEPFVNRVRAGVPTLGICLGMHLIF